jgi:hypothetical protein
MIGQIISHIKILEELGEVPKWLTSASERAIAIVRIPACLSEFSDTGRPPFVGGSSTKGFV